MVNIWRYERYAHKHKIPLTLEMLSKAASITFLQAKAFNKTNYRFESCSLTFIELSQYKERDGFIIPVYFPRELQHFLAPNGIVLWFWSGACAWNPLSCKLLVARSRLLASDRFVRPPDVFQCLFRAARARIARIVWRARVSTGQLSFRVYF